MKTIGSKVEDEIYNVFRLVCEKDGVTISDRVKDLVKKFLEEEAPFIMLDQDVSKQLKEMAKEKGVDWREMTCAIIVGFCEKCKEKEAKTETEKQKEVPRKIKILKESELKREEEAPIEEKKPKSIVKVLSEALEEEEKKPLIGEKGVKIIRE